MNQSSLLKDVFLWLNQFNFNTIFYLQCLSPDHVTNGRVHHTGLNGSSKSLATSTHPMLARGTSADRFSPLEPRDFEVESLSRKTVVGNSIIILKGKLNENGWPQRPSYVINELLKKFWTHFSYFSFLQWVSGI